MSNDHKHEHHILSNKMAFTIWGLLLLGTVITVVIAKVDLGPINMLVALLVATAKAMLVCLFFMGLKYDSKENVVIFSASVLFVAIFLALTASDLFFRGDVYVKPGQAAFTAPIGKSKFKKPWVSTPEILANGKQLYVAQCVACHGAEGKGDGPAAGSMNPKPRNFTSADAWKNGRKPSQVFGTLTKGLGGMPAFGSMPMDDRWSLAHYVNSLGPSMMSDSDADLKAIGIDPTKEDAGGSGEKSIPIDLAIKLMSVD